MDRFLFGIDTDRRFRFRGKGASVDFWVLMLAALGVLAIMGGLS